MCFTWGKLFLLLGGPITPQLHTKPSLKDPRLLGQLAYEHTQNKVVIKVTTAVHFSQL